MLAQCRRGAANPLLLALVAKRHARDRVAADHLVLHLLEEAARHQLGMQVGAASIQKLRRWNSVGKEFFYRLVEIARGGPGRKCGS